MSKGVNSGIGRETANVHRPFVAADAPLSLDEVGGGVPLRHAAVLRGVNASVDTVQNVTVVEGRPSGSPDVEVVLPFSPGTSAYIGNFRRITAIDAQLTVVAGWIDDGSV